MLEPQQLMLEPQQLMLEPQQLMLEPQQLMLSQQIRLTQPQVELEAWAELGNINIAYNCLQLIHFCPPKRKMQPDGFSLMNFDILFTFLHFFNLNRYIQASHG